MPFRCFECDVPNGTPEFCRCDPLVNALAEWEDANGTMAVILPSEWDDLKQRVMDACVHQSPRQLRMQIHRLRYLLARYRDETPLGHQPSMIAHLADEALGRASATADANKT